MMPGVVVVVDDNVAFLRSMKFLLELEGCEVVTYTSPVAALADETVRPICLIIDQNMPEITGTALATRLRQRLGPIPVLLACGFVTADLMARATELGIERLLEKPLDPKDILQFIAEFAHRPAP
jgi:FixJ family two-component response regulator